MTRAVLLWTSVIVAAGCGQEKIEVRTGASADYNHTALMRAVDKFVAADRTPAAYAELTSTVLALRSGMDRAVAREAELKLIVLGLAPVKAVAAQPVAQQTETLALTVWPALLAPPIEADDLLDKRDPDAAAYLPGPAEDARGYLIRLCGDQLSGECKQVVPESQGAVVSAVAIRRATERARNAVADCVLCSAEPGWHQAVRSWEALDRMASAGVAEIERQADPANWPVAGAAAEATRPLAEALPEAQINELGELVIAGQRYGADRRVRALRDARGDDDAIALHLRPETSLAQVRGILADARQSGAARVAVVARAPGYPWDRRLYWIADGTGTKVRLRPSDTLQVLLAAVDAIAATPGAIARVD